MPDWLMFGFMVYVVIVLYQIQRTVNDIRKVQHGDIGSDTIDEFSKEFLSITQEAKKKAESSKNDD